MLNLNAVYVTNTPGTPTNLAIKTQSYRYQVAEDTSGEFKVVLARSIKVESVPEEAKTLFYELIVFQT